MDKNDIALIVDLDGTLLKTDSLWEAFFRLAVNKPWLVFFLPFFLLKGIPYLKERISPYGLGDVKYWPFNPDVLSWIHTAREQGRHVCLATAAHISIAQAVTDHLQCFDSVIATAGSTNLKSGKKLLALKEKFGIGGFDYIGDSSADLPIWKESHMAILVDDPNSALAQKMKSENANSHILPLAPPTLFTYVKALRIYQWSKNALVFVPLILSHSFTLNSVGNCVLAALSFSLLASAIYILNDLCDLPSDRRHPTKWKRPFASGRLPLWQGPIVLLPLLLLGTVIFACFLGHDFFYILTTYLILNVLYSYWLKRKIIIDVVILAILYVSRIVAGAIALGIDTSNWLLGFAFFIFLGLALIKRFSELEVQREQQRDNAPGRSYRIDDKPLLESMAVSSGFGSIVILALYIDTLKAAELYTRPLFIWLLCPLVIYWYGRLLILAKRAFIHDDPISFVLTDRLSWLCGLIGIGIILISL